MASPTQQLQQQQYNTLQGYHSNGSNVITSNSPAYHNRSPSTFSNNSTPSSSIGSMQTQGGGGGGSFIDPKREQEFASIFSKELPSNEKLIEDYSCALQERILAHGRMYISHNYVSFHSTLFGVTTLVLPLKNIIGIYKRNTALVFPNAIEIDITLKDKEQKLLFTSFLFRDQAYQSLIIALQQARDNLNADEPITQSPADSSSDLSPLVEGEKQETEEGSSSGEFSEEEFEEGSSDSEPEIKVEPPTVNAPPMSSSPSKETKPRRERFEHSSFDEYTYVKRSDSVATSKRVRSQSFTLNESPKIKFTDAIRRTSMDLEAPVKPVAPLLQINGVASQASVGPDNQPPVPQDDVTIVPPVAAKCNHFEDVEENFSFTEVFPLTVSNFFLHLLSDKSTLWHEVNLAMEYTDAFTGPWAITDCCCRRELSFVSPITAPIGPKKNSSNPISSLLFEEYRSYGNGN